MAERSDANVREAVLGAGVVAQRLVPGCIAVGGSVAALDERRRVS